MSAAGDPPPRWLVVTADDLGLSPAVNAGVADAHRKGVVTSASLMVLRPAAAEAAAIVGDLPRLSVGLHLELASYEVVDGSWAETSRVADPDDARAVADAVEFQLDRFGELLGRTPDHLDSHHHLHDREPARSVVRAAATRLGVPVRGQGPWRYCGDFYGQWGAGRPWPEGTTVPALLAVLGRLGPGVTELASHPAVAGHREHGTYDTERVQELRTLTDPVVVDAVRAAGIRLIPSRDVLAVAAAQPKRPET